MKKIKNHTKLEYRKALTKQYKNLIEEYSKLELQKECIHQLICPNCLQHTYIWGSLPFECSECGFILTDKQYNRLFEELW